MKFKIVKQIFKLDNVRIRIRSQLELFVDAFLIRN